MSNAITIRVPERLVPQCNLLKKSQSWVDKVLLALRELAAREPSDTAAGAHIRMRMYALNSIGERLVLLLRLLDADATWAQPAIIRQLLEFVALGVCTEPLMPKVRGASKFVFVRHRAQDEEVKVYGAKFVLRGLAELGETDEKERLRPIVDTLYEDTSAFTHPSPRDMARFIEGMKKALGSIEQYANLVHAMVSALCFRLNRDHDLKTLSQDDLQEYMTEAMRRRAR